MLEDERRRQLDRALASSNEARLDRIVELFRHNKPYKTVAEHDAEYPPRGKKKLNLGRGGVMPLRSDGKWDLRERLRRAAERAKDGQSPSDGVREPRRRNRSVRSTSGRPGASEHPETG